MPLRRHLLLIEAALYGGRSPAAGRRTGCKVYFILYTLQVSGLAGGGEQAGRLGAGAAAARRGDPRLVSVHGIKYKV